MNKAFWTVKNIKIAELIIQNKKGAEAPLNLFAYKNTISC